MGGLAFLDLKDASGRIQVSVRKELGEEQFGLLRDLDLGDFLGVEGSVYQTRTGETTIEAQTVTILAKALRAPPEKWHGLVDIETRHRQRYLDLIANPEAERIFILRSRIVAAIRRFMSDRGFLEVETPILHTTAAGAMATPFITHHNQLDMDLYLRIATELHLKRCIVGGMEKVYEIGRIFRNEGVSFKHNPEFTTMESYEAYADYNDVMSMVETLVSTVAREVLGTTEVVSDGQTIDLAPPWRRMTLREAILQKTEIDFVEHADEQSLRAAMQAAGIYADPTKGRGKLIDDLLSKAVEPTLQQPTFLVDYPVELSPLAKRKEDDLSLVERFEAFCGGMEIANAFTELNDPIDQWERFRQQVRAREAGDEEADVVDEDFLIAIEHGMPPTGGLGMGIDRLVMLLTDQASIRDVILFPTNRPK
jgi:lysyl-tRNA synthetase class 2